MALLGTPTTNIDYFCVLIDVKLNIMKEAGPSQIGNQAANQGANPFDIQAYQELISSPGGVIEQIK